MLHDSRDPILLHDNTLSAAAILLSWLAHVHLALWGARAECARAGWVRRHFLVVPTDLTDEVVESVFDVDARFRGRFNELATELSRKGLTL